jgi:hypothetical protein
MRPGHRAKRWGIHVWALPKVCVWGGAGCVHSRKVHQQPRLPPTVLTSPLLHTECADLHFIRGAQRPPWGHEAHGCCAEEAVCSAQGWRTEPARPGQR